MADGKTEGLNPAERLDMEMKGALTMTRSLQDINESYENILEARYQKNLVEECEHRDEWFDWAMPDPLPMEKNYQYISRCFNFPESGTVTLKGKCDRCGGTATLTYELTDVSFD